MTRHLCKWLSQGRTSVEPRMEQVLPDEAGRLDIVYVDEGAPTWLDVAVTSCRSRCSRSLANNARSDGAAGKAEEAVKRYRYHGRATPVVWEADGRPAAAAISLIRRHAKNCHEGYSTSAASIWNSLSSVLQSWNSTIEILAWGSQCVFNQKAIIHIE